MSVLEDDQSSVETQGHDDEGPAADYITQVGPNDIVVGRGVNIASFPGNVQYRALIALHKKTYSSTGRHRRKQEVAVQVLRSLKKRGARCLRQATESEKVGWNIPVGVDAWVILRNYTAQLLIKIKQALREFDNRKASTQSPSPPFVSSHTTDHDGDSNESTDSPPQVALPPPPLHTIVATAAASAAQFTHQQQQQQTVASNYMYCNPNLSMAPLMVNVAATAGRALNDMPLASNPAGVPVLSSPSSYMWNPLQQLQGPSTMFPLVAPTLAAAFAVSLPPPSISTTLQPYYQPVQQLSHTSNVYGGGLMTSGINSPGSHFTPESSLAPAPWSVARPPTPAASLAPVASLTPAPLSIDTMVAALQEQHVRFHRIQQMQLQVAMAATASTLNSSPPPVFRL